MTTFRAIALVCTFGGVAVLAWAFLRGSREGVSKTWLADQQYDREGDRL